MTVGNGADYVNVDMSRPVGIERAKGMGLGSSGLADIISTPFLFETADIFRDIPEAGKCFTLLRHPVDRAISLYHHYQIDESGNPNTAQYRGMTIDDYADQAAENNWMVRFLANKRSGSLNWHDLEVAKEGWFSLSLCVISAHACYTSSCYPPLKLITQYSDGNASLDSLIKPKNR